jgi:hypothetical protein
VEPFTSGYFSAISAFKSGTASHVGRLTVWQMDCTSISVGSRKTKNFKETQDHGKSKDSEKGQETRISEAAGQARGWPQQQVT